MSVAKDNAYFFHQTPPELARALIATLPLEPTDVLLEPFRGEGAFFNAYPAENPKDWAEIVEGRDYKDISGSFDWVITNPPFKLQNGTKRVNAFWFLLDYYTQRAKKGIAFLANDACFCTLTPRRMTVLKERGWSIQKVVVCAVKKWRGRYFFIVLKKEPVGFVSFLPTNYE